MLYLTSEKTYKIIYYVLEKGKFKQLHLSKDTKVSLGRVNKVVKWLEEKHYVRKIGANYELVAAAPLISALNHYVEVEKQSFDIVLEKEKVLSHLKKKKAVFCNTSALQFYTSYFRDPSINIYFNKEIAEELSNSQEGNLRINMFKTNLSLPKNNLTKKNGFILTTQIRTIIDLYADNKAYTTEPLIKKLVAK